MLLNTFQHIPGVGPKSEDRLWSAGVTDWNRIEMARRLKLTRKRMDSLAEQVRASLHHWQERNPAWFEKALPARLHWRFFPEFRSRTVYLDIETDGLDRDNGNITTIALYDGRTIKTYVNGRNLETFADDIRHYQVIVSYNGKCFDVPYIQDYLGITLPQAHIDLRYVLGALGYKGGLKRCETALGIERSLAAGIDGMMAPMLWQEYKVFQKSEALETLLAYNVEDVVNLERLMVTAYNLNLVKTPFGKTHIIPEPTLPEIPFRVDRRIVEGVKRELTAIGTIYDHRY